MRRLAVGVVVLVAAGAAMLAMRAVLSYGSRLPPTPHPGDPTSARPPVHSLATVATQTRPPNSPDPAAEGRIRAVWTSLVSGELTAADVDGVPVMAVVRPAGWLQRTDVDEVFVMVLGRAEPRYDLSLTAPGGEGSGVSLRSHPAVTSFRTTEGVWVHSYRAYVDADWSAVSDADAMRMSDLGSPTDGAAPDELRRRYDRLAARSAGREVIVRGRVIPLVASPG
jgi:hypothetical protein